MNTIFFICLYPIILILYFVMKVNTKSKKNMIIGVTLPTEFLEDKEVIEICRLFKKDLNKITIIYALIPFTFLLTGYESISLTLWMIWMIAVIFNTMWPYIKYNKKLSILKAEKQWKIINIDMEMIDITKMSESIKTINKPLFFTAIIISFVPGVFELFQTIGSKRFPIIGLDLLAMGSVTLCFFIMGILMDRQKTEVISLDSEINANFNRAKKRIWTKSFLVMGWINTLYLMVMWAFFEYVLDSTMLFMFLSMIYTILLIYLCFRAGLHVRKMQRETIGEASEEVLIDDDANWIYGIIYYNPNDKHTMVDKRVGIGTTINMATNAGKWVIGLTIGSILLIPIMCIWLMFEEFTPISLEYSNNQIIAEHLKTEYTINVDDIKEVKLITEIPSSKKIMGTAMDNIDKGSFRVDGYGDCDLCLDPKTKVFIVVKTSNDTYILGDKDSVITQRIYDVVSKMVKH